MEFLDPVLNHAISKWYEARSFAKSYEPEAIIQMKAPKDSSLAELFGTAPMLRWLWDNVSTFRKFFSSYGIGLERLMDNVFVSRLLMLWDFNIAYVQYVCIVFDYASAQALSLSRRFDRPEYWFCQTVKTVCQEIRRSRAKNIVPRRDYATDASEFIADARCDVERWKRWKIVDVPPSPLPPPPPRPPAKRAREASPERAIEYQADLEIFQNILRDKLKQSNDKISLIKKLTVALVQM